MELLVTHRYTHEHLFRLECVNVVRPVKKITKELCNWTSIKSSQLFLSTNFTLFIRMNSLIPFHLRFSNVYCIFLAARSASSPWFLLLYLFFSIPVFSPSYICAELQTIHRRIKCKRRHHTYNNIQMIHSHQLIRIIRRCDRSKWMVKWVLQREMAALASIM